MVLLDFSLPEAQWLDGLNSTIPWQRAMAEFIAEWRSSANRFSIQTSGSTGVPKTIQHTRDALIRSASRTNAFFDINANSNCLLCLPITHIGGRMMCIRAIIAKAKLFCVVPSANPLLLFKERHNIQFAAFTPMQCFTMLQHKETVIPFSTIQQVIIGGGTISAALVQLLSGMPNLIYETFGMTETISHIALRKVAPEADYYFQCLNGITISANAQMLLQIQIENDAPIQTTDVAEVLDNKRFQWLGRADEAINTGGIKVFAHKIEQQLLPQFQFPFFITASPDDKFGQRVVMVLQSMEYAKTLTKDSFAALSNFERPKSIFVLQQFEYSDLGKLLKQKSIEHHFLTRIDL